MGRGIDRRGLVADRLEHRDLKPVPGALGPQQIRRPTAPVPKGAIPADDHVAGAYRSDDDFGNKVLRTRGGEAEIEMLDEQQIDAEARQFALLDAERRQPERLGPRKENAARMRLEGQHRGRSALGLRTVADLAKQYGMPPMQAVEIAYREDRTTRMVRAGAGMSDDADHASRAPRLRAGAAKIARGAP
jgi:hypothetical protein